MHEMGSRRSHLCSCLLAILWVCTICAEASAQNQKLHLKRSDAKRWKNLGERMKQAATSQSQNFLNKRGQELGVPIVIDILALGFDGEGAYKVKLQMSKLEEMLQTSFNRYCPSIWDTKQEAGICYYITYNVVKLAQHGQDIHELERYLKAHMTATNQRDHSRDHEPDLEADHDHDHDHEHEHEHEYGRPIYEIEGLEVEHWFQTAWHAVYGAEDETGSKHWHKHNAIFLINPSKLRMSPVLANDTLPAEDIDPLENWQRGNMDNQQLAGQEGGYVYQYKYYGEGGTSTWVSSENYVVVDISAGPCMYGPIASPTGVVTRKSVPRLQEVLVEMLEEVAEVHQVTAREAAVAQAVAGHEAVFLGHLVGPLVGASQHVFMPDVASAHLEYARRVLVPIIVLRDHDDVDPLVAPQEGGLEYYINQDEIDHAVKQLLGPDQQAVFTSTSYYIHHHPNLLAALQKAMHTEAEMHWDGWEQSDGLHMQLSSFLDGPTLLEEFSLAADMLTEGLFEHETQYEEHNWEGAHELRHMGTRVIPVFVLSLKQTPENLLFRDRQLVAADREAVIVLQLTDPHDAEGYYTGGVMVGHESGGQHVVMDAHNPTRHIIAGLATSIAGIVPPFQRYNPQRATFTSDWMWAVGAHPFGPYSAYPGVSTTTAAVAQRNILLSHSEAALRKAQAAQQKLDTFVATHLQSPLQQAGEDPPTHYLDVLHEPAKAYAKRRGGFNTSLTVDVVAALEGLLLAVDDSISTLLISLYDHRFQDSHTHIADLHAQVDAFVARVDSVVDEGEALLECCSVLHQADSILTYGGVWGAVASFVLICMFMALITLTRPSPRAPHRRNSRGILG